MIPVTQFILGNSDPLLYPSEKMTNSIDEQDVEPCDVYVAINAQYHDYAKLFEEWFGGNIDNKVFESAITFWFKDVDFDGDKVWEYFHMNN
nr:MAG: hypothetical protein [Bacteriophage sp.]